MSTTVYVTKYWQTAGIQERQASITESGAYALITNPNAPGQYFRMRRDAFLDRDEAVKRVEVLRLKQIKSLHMRIAKLKAMRIE